MTRVVAQWLASIGAAIAAVWAIYARGKAAERQRAQAEAMREALRRREVRDAVENDVAREPDAAERLRQRWSRD